MGYYTYYDLSIHDSAEYKYEIEKKKTFEIEEIKKSNISNDLKNKLIEKIENSYSDFEITKDDVIEHIGFNPFSDKCKWYSHEDDMRSVSNIYKDIIFVLTGNGEEKEDMWVKYFFNGKMQVENAVITYGQFDKNKLK